jgi:phenylpropionate dioxygenase-like ring-hydroxylating dioxygenase large terminal subunit
MMPDLTAAKTNLGLPSHCYNDPDIFAREMKAIWRQTWHWVGRAESLQQPGDYLTCMIGEEPIFVIRGDDGSLQAMHNICRHRGAQLLEGQGNCQKLVCPYHAWTYSQQGQLLGISHTKLFPGLDKSTIQLVPAQVDTWGGFIFVHPDPEGESLLNYLADFPAYLCQYSQVWEDLREVTRFHYTEPINWKLIVENYVEDYHFAFAHAKTLALLFDVEQIRTIPTGQHLKICVPYATKPPEKRGKYLWEAGQFSYQGFIFPNLMINTSKDHVAVWRVTPLDALHSHLEMVVYQTPDQFHQYPFTVEEFGLAVDEDFAVCRKLQAGVNSRAYRVTQLALEHEIGVAHFHQVLSKYL